MARNLFCCDLIHWQHLISPQASEFCQEKIKAYGPGISGALFGAGWWFWLDAVATTSEKIPFSHYLPGFVATLALIMINAIRRDELQEIDPFDEGTYCRSRAWLFVSYCVSFAAIAASVWVLLQSYALNPDAGSSWPGAAGVFQVIFILGSGLFFFVSRTPGEGSSYSDYNNF